MGETSPPRDAGGRKQRDRSREPFELSIVPIRRLRAEHHRLVSQRQPGETRSLERLAG